MGIPEDIQEAVSPREQPACHSRSDDAGFLNIIKAWGFPAIHLVMSVAILIVLIQIDGSHFGIGADVSLAVGPRLYQSQLTGILSAALVILRVFVGSATVTLTWRVIFILLEKQGITLAEWIRLTTWRAPVTPNRSSITSLTWSLWAAAVVLLLWPPVFSAPLATSALAWIPSSTLMSDAVMIPVPNTAGTDKFEWLGLENPGVVSSIVVNAAAMTGDDPAYAASRDGRLSRRHFPAHDVANNSLIDLTVPYISIQMNWINADESGKSDIIGNETLSYVTSPFRIRDAGTTVFVRDKKWELKDRIPTAATPPEPIIFSDKILLYMHLETLDPDYPPYPNLDDDCPTSTGYFDKIPDVNQHRFPYGARGGGRPGAYECYIMGEATITAGQIAAKNCRVSSVESSSKAYATCPGPFDESAIERSLMTGLALDFMSDTIKYSIMQNNMGVWMSDTLDGYAVGLLTSAYHASWSALFNRVAISVFTDVPVTPSEETVRLLLDRKRLYAWLGMNLCLTISTLLVAIGQRLSSTKTIRDTTVAALTIDLTPVTHDPRARGLCDAVELSKADGKLPRLQWQTAHKLDRDGELGAVGGGCRRRIVFADDENGAQDPLRPDLQNSDSS